MNNKEGLAKLKRVRDELTAFVDRISLQCTTDDIIYELMLRRKYTSQQMFDTLKEVGIFKLDYISELMMLDPSVTAEQLKDWGLITENGDYILKGRYTVPIRDISGKVAALVGWYPDIKKYITSPTFGFSRDAMFFNMDCYKHSILNWDGTVYLVEGIFDTLSLRSLGFPALGDMGLEMGSLKTQILTRFKKVIAIPDNDKAGRSVSRFTNRVSGKSKKFIWKIENEHVFVTLPKGVKDVDDFIKEFDAYEDLLSCQSNKFIKKLKEDA